MASSWITEYLWPRACPVCHARFDLLDRLLLQVRRLATVTAFVRGQSTRTRRDLRRCDWCDMPNSAPKLRQDA